MFLPAVSFVFQRVNVFHFRKSPPFPFPLQAGNIIFHVLPRFRFRRRVRVGQGHVQVVRREIVVHQEFKSEPRPLFVVFLYPLRRQVPLRLPDLPLFLPSPCRIDFRHQDIPGHRRCGPVSHLTDPQVAAFFLPPARLPHGNLERRRSWHVKQG